MKEYKYFTIQQTNFVSVVNISREDKSNAFNEETWEELGMIFSALSNDPHTRVILLTGQGQNFSAGMDLSTLMGLPTLWQGNDESEKSRRVQAFIKKIQDCITSIEKCSKPVIACIQGACIGGAMSIVTACDFMFASKDAYFSIKETQLGIVPDIGVLQRIPHFVATGKIAELAYTSRNLSAQEAWDIHLVNELFDDKESMITHAHTVAQSIASNPPRVVEGVKKMIQYRRTHSVEESLDYVSLWNASYLMSSELAEAMTAYMAKRKPKY